MLKSAKQTQGVTRITDELSSAYRILAKFRIDQRFLIGDFQLLKFIASLMGARKKSVEGVQKIKVYCHDSDLTIESWTNILTDTTDSIEIVLAKNDDPEFLKNLSQNVRQRASCWCYATESATKNSFVLFEPYSFLYFEKKNLWVGNFFEPATVKSLQLIFKLLLEESVPVHI